MRDDSNVFGIDGTILPRSVDNLLDKLKELHEKKGVVELFILGKYRDGSDFRLLTDQTNAEVSYDLVREIIRIHKDAFSDVPIPFDEDDPA